MDIEEHVEEAIKFYDSSERQNYSDQRIRNEQGNVLACLSASIDKRNPKRDTEILNWLN